MTFVLLIAMGLIIILFTIYISFVLTKRIDGLEELNIWLQTKEEPITHRDLRDAQRSRDEKIDELEVKINNKFNKQINELKKIIGGLERKLQQNVAYLDGIPVPMDKIKELEDKIALLRAHATTINAKENLILQQQINNNKDDIKDLKNEIMQLKIK